MEEDKRYILTEKGIKYIERMSSRAVPVSGSSFGSFLLDVHQDSDLPDYPKWVKKAIEGKYVVEDTRPVASVLSDIKSRAPSLGSTLETYWRLARQDPRVEDWDVDSALDEMSKRPYSGAATSYNSLSPESRTLLARRSRMTKGEKVAALDRFIQEIHREGLLSHYPPSIANNTALQADVVIVLDKLAI